MRVYISGPISGDPNFQARFLAAESALRLRGYDTINPGRLCMVAHGLTHRQYMQICMKLLRFADGIYLLNGFERSEGAMREFNRALSLRNIKLIWRESDGPMPEWKHYEQ